MDRDYNSTSRGLSGLVGSDKLNAPIAERPQSAVESEVNMLHTSSSQLQDLMLELERRLEVVLRIQPPQSIGNEKVGQELTPLPNAIRKSRMIVENTLFKVKDILARLDI